MTTRFVRPAPIVEGEPALRRILDPVTRQPVPAEGLEVEWSTYWMRRQAAGDVLLAPADSAPIAAPAAPVKTKD